jgi:hypothetical protein
MSPNSIDSAASNRISSPPSVDRQVLTTEAAQTKVLETHKSNIQEIEKSLQDNSAGYGQEITIQVPAGQDGKPILYPTENDWIEAAKNGTFVDTTGKAADLSRIYYETNLVDFGNAELNAQINSALLGEVSAALDRGSLSISQSERTPTTEGNMARAILARQSALNKISGNVGTYGQMATPPAEQITIKVPADANGVAIKNPSLQDWVNAEKNNQYTEVTQSPFDLAKEYFGVSLDTNWRSAYSENRDALRTAGEQANEQAKNLLSFNRAVDSGNRMDTTALDGLDPSTINEALAIFGKNYSDAMSRSTEESNKMDSLRKKYDALKNLENSISGNNTAGDNDVTISVPTRRYVVDAEGNRVKDANGNYQTAAITNPPSNDDWANAVPDSFQNVTMKGRDAAKQYFNIELSATSGDNAHNINLSNNLTKISNERSLVDAEMKKISGKFDFWMGNVQTILSMINKLVSQVNDNILTIAKGI